MGWSRVYIDRIAQWNFQRHASQYAAATGAVALQKRSWSMGAKDNGEQWGSHRMVIENDEIAPSLVRGGGFAELGEDDVFDGMMGDHVGGRGAVELEAEGCGGEGFEGGRDGFFVGAHRVLVGEAG